MQTPSIGRIVVVKGPTANGTDEHPAIVNRVWGPCGDSKTPDPYFMCNTTAFLDTEGPRPVTSIYVFQNRDQALRYRTSKTVTDGVVTYPPFVAFFPERA